MEGTYRDSVDVKHLEMTLYMRRLLLLVAECAPLTTPQIKVIKRVLWCIERRFSGNAVLAHDVGRVREALYASENGKRPGQHAVIAVCTPSPRRNQRVHRAPARQLRDRHARANTPPEKKHRARGDTEHAASALCRRRLRAHLRAARSSEHGKRVRG